MSQQFWVTSEEKSSVYWVRNGRVMKGQSIIALYDKDSEWVVSFSSPDFGRKIGKASTPAEAMLMAIRDHEGGRRS